MVRFKNRWLLVEFLFPSEYGSTMEPVPNAITSTISNPAKRRKLENGTVGRDEPTEGENDGLQDEYIEANGEENDPADLPLEFYPSLSRNPAPLNLAPAQVVLLTSSTNSTSIAPSSVPASRSSSTGSGTRRPPLTTRTTGTPPGAKINEKMIWVAIKENVIETAGDAGWGKVGSSLGVKYYSPTTSLCILRVAREHYRLIWSALTFLNQIGSERERVIARVVCCSGTMKKLQLNTVRYSRRVVAGYLGHAVRMFDAEQAKQAEIEAWKKRTAMIEADLAKLEETQG